MNIKINGIEFEVVDGKEGYFNNYNISFYIKINNSKDIDFLRKKTISQEIIMLDFFENKTTKVLIKELSLHYDNIYKDIIFVNFFIVR